MFTESQLCRKENSVLPYVVDLDTVSYRDSSRQLFTWRYVLSTSSFR